ncbi:MAG: hypothetical protein AAF620_15275 [Bacteroidota bacterium]
MVKKKIVFDKNLPDMTDIKYTDPVPITDIPSITDSLYADLMRQFNEALIEELAKNGFTFDHRAQLEQFLKTRGELEVYPNKLNILRVDGKIVCEWWNTLKVDRDENSIAVTIGVPPGEETSKL